MIHQPLQFYTDKLKQGERFSLARYGDGELHCMWGKRGQNSNGCRYSPELRHALLNSMRFSDDPTFIYGIQRVLPQDQARAEQEYPINWHDSEIFSEAVANGTLFPFIEQLKKMKVVVISNASIKNVTKEILNWQKFGEVPAANAYDMRLPIIEFVRENDSKDTVFLFSCGMAANAFIGKLHWATKGWLLDVGHIWDPFTGNMSRCDLKGKTIEDIRKNLLPL